MRILVCDVAAEDGGGLEVLKTFYSDALAFVQVHQDVEFVLLLSRPLVPAVERIQVQTYPWIKKSWLHRLVFDQVFLKKIVNAIAPDCVISLQNTTIGGYTGPQYVYMHQSLQYCSKRFSFFRSAERSLAIRQRLICAGYRRGLKKAQHVYVQTNWIKEATLRWTGLLEECITVVPITVADAPHEAMPYTGMASRRFFYPARPEIYKNHSVIIEACQQLVKKGISDFEVLFTVDPQSNAYAKSIQTQCQGLPIQCIGSIVKEQIWSYYSSTILVFPSYLETCGLPLHEAQRMQAVILTADMPFAQEALSSYPNAHVFAYDDATALADLMERCLSDEMLYEPAPLVKHDEKEIGLLRRMMQDILMG